MQNLSRALTGGKEIDLALAHCISRESHPLCNLTCLPLRRKKVNAQGAVVKDGEKVKRRAKGAEHGGAQVDRIQEMVS